MQWHKNVTKNVIYIVFYNNEVAFGCHYFLEYVIQCCLMEVHGFLGDMIVDEEAWLERKMMSFSPADTFGN